jgi:arylsulfatase A-like enzyme
MNRRNFLGAAAMGALLTSCAGLTPPPTAKIRKPKQNFLFILVDDLGWRDLGCFGSSFYETPHIDRLAREGMRFTDAYAACPVCSPTRASIMTGKYPARMATTDWFGAPQPETAHQHKTGTKPLLPAPYVDQLPRDEITIAEALKMSGYNTFFTGKWHLGGKDHYPEDQGFEHNRGGFEKGSPKSYFSPYNNPKLKDGPEGEHLPDRLARESVGFLEDNGNHPFLLFLSFYSVHTPLQGRKDLIEKYEAKAKQVTHEGPEFIPEGEHQARQVQNHAVYAAMVEAMDTAVGTVLDGLARLGLADTTTVFFMSDNGGLSTAEGAPTSNVPLRAGKGWLYEGGIREPLIVKCPGVTAPGSECRHPVTSTDFYPTLLELAGLPPRPEQHRDAVSFAPLLRGETLPKDRPLFWHYPHYGNQGAFPGAAVRLGAYKLIEFFEDGHLELYNLRDDPGEQCNLINEAPNYAEPMIDMLHAWQREVGARFPTPNPNAAAKPGE